MNEKKITPQMRYQKKNVRVFKLDCIKNTEMDIIEKLEKVKLTEGYATYIKRLIREDIKKEEQ